MATTYDPTLPTPRDRMRHTLGDIADPPLRPDAEYDALLARYSEPIATMKMAESLASEYAQNPSSVNVGGVSVSYSSLVSTWRVIADSLRKEFGSGHTAQAGGFTGTSLQRFPVDRAEYAKNREDWIGRDPW